MKNTKDLFGEADFRFVKSFGSEGTGECQFQKPSGVAVDDSDNVYVADTLNDRIVRFNSRDFSGTFKSFNLIDPLAAGGLGLSFTPHDLAIDPNGNVYIADSFGSRIVEINLSDPIGTFISFGKLGKVGYRGADKGRFHNPFGVALDSSKNLYVTDTSNSRIVRFALNDFAGSFTSFGTEGSDDGQFYNPEGLTVDSSGNIYVADTENSRIIRFKPSNFATTFTSFGTYGSSNGEFSRPRGVVLDSKGNVYVADTSNDRIVRFNPDNFLNTFTSFGREGSGKGKFSYPTKIAIDGKGNVYIADDGNSRIVQLSTTP
jgi:sugar lactone lactonase YvrE